ncbi:hypothetical protein ABLE94_19180 [Gordonia sp. VNK1]|uniref:hypothetical protein n=1 Tax=Gordonia oleivorans TaxID=3156618 RepID=UPI0032B589E9
MKSRAEQIREQAARVVAQPSNRSAEGAGARARLPAVPKSKRVGKTVNLDANLNQRVVAWQTAAATSLGLPRVTFQAVIDCLLEELFDDERLSMRVRQRIDESQ